ncbi:MAG TPA: carbamoyltransferase C-terminal domain-containing protein [Flavitalea sp.]|nr:carbamoyltransferase C-terminal domain-containing protein [Flavitalea sp.]
MLILGINAAFHDSAACILKDGKLLAAVEEERFTHIKHGKRPIPFSAYEMPFHSISYCLEMAGAHINDIDHFAYSFDPSLAHGPEHPAFMEANINARLHLRDGYPHHLQNNFIGADIPESKWHFVEHHISHAASAFHASPYQEAAILTIDGRGENATTSYYYGNGNELDKLSQVYLPHSLGLLYEKMTTYLGFLHSSDEYKVMALASYGKPVFADIFRSMIHINGTGDYTITDNDFEKHFGPGRKKDDPFTDHHFNIANSLQLVLEESALKLISWLHKETGSNNLCMAGGVALNCVMNARLRDHGPFKNIWVQPAAGDAGTALGAALWIDARERSLNGHRSFVMDHAYWGPEYSDQQIEAFLKWTKTPYRKLQNVAAETAAILAEDKIIGWFQGRMEFGPRALGSRSILASPINPSMQARLNEVKDREDFRPVAPVVLEEDAPDWFEQAKYSPFMLFIYDVKPDKANKIPAVRHVDGTARIQTVNRSQHPKYYDLLTEFKKITGVPILVNTSFNTLGKPIVCTPRDALECFWGSPFDALVIGSFLIEK